MSSPVESVIDELRNRGFARFAGAVDAATVAALQSAAQDLARTKTESWDGAASWFAEAKWRAAHFAEAGRNANYYDCLGLDARLDGAVDDLLAKPQIRELLDRVLGADYRLWYAQLRWAEPGGDEYVLHQDVFGELGLCIYLSDHRDDAGSMVFWPASHRWPRVLEVLPPLQPGPVRPWLQAVDGDAGDVCVFLNKTWHGRTSARDGIRLVLLLSFIPPGPLEKGRRLPESVRDRLGPELRRVTAPEAGRSFGKRPPSAPALSSVCEQPVIPDPVCTFANHGERAIHAYAWAWCMVHARRDVDASGRGDALWRFKRIARESVAYSVLPRATLEALVEEFRRRAVEQGLGLRTYHQMRMTHALWNGDVAAARHEFARWRASGRDWLCDTPADEADAVASFHGETGDEAALRAAAPADPDSATSRLLLPLARCGRFDQAARLHRLDYPKVAWNVERFQAIGRHLEYLALRAEPGDGLTLFRQHLPMALRHRCDGELWSFWSGAFVLFARMRRRGASSIATVHPGTGEEGCIPADDLVERLDARLQELADRFDGRNRNGWRNGLRAKLQERIDWDPLPEPGRA